jgi:hypothetical protein
LQREVAERGGILRSPKPGKKSRKEQGRGRRHGDAWTECRQTKRNKIRNVPKIEKESLLITKAEMLTKEQDLE